MTFSTLYMRVRVFWVLPFLSIFLCYIIFSMPVINRSQAKSVQQTTSSSSEPSVYLTSPTSESLSIQPTIIHSMSTVHVSSNDCVTLVALTSLIDECSDHTESYIPSSLINSTSLIDERSNPYVSDPNIASIVDRSLITTAVPRHVNLKFQNNSESERISNSNSLSINHGTHDSSPHLSSHNSVVSNFSIMADDDDDGSPYPYAGQRAQATQNLMDMNDLFAAIKTHLSDATQQLSGDFRQIVDDNTRLKQETREELDAMRKFLADQKNILGIRSSSNSSSNVPLAYLQAVTTSPPPAPMPLSLSVTPPTPQPAQDVQSQMQRCLRIRSPSYLVLYQKNQIQNLIGQSSRVMPRSFVAGILR
jgi:hypothetical protein